MKQGRPLSVIKVFLTLISVFTLSAYAQAQSLIRDAEIEEMLADFSTPLIRAAGLNPDNVDIYIVNDKSLNAFVTRGQNIFFHTGLIAQSETPNQLKGVIAHEVAHIAAGHIVRRGEATRSAYAAALIAAGIGLAAILAGEGQAGALILAGAPQQYGALSILAYSRVNEASADQYAAQYLERTGQSGEGLIQFFEKFRYQEVLSYARRFPYFRGHPLSSQRINNLRERTAESPHFGKGDSVEDLYRLDMVKAKLEGFLAAPQTVFQKHPPDDQSDFALYARSVAYFRSADLRTALKEIDVLLKRQPDNAYFHELKAQILFESGKIEESIPPSEKALLLKPDHPLLKVSLARALIAIDEEDESQQAVELLKSALRQEPSNGLAWFSLSQAYAQIGQESLAKYAIAEQAYRLGDYQRARSFAQRAQKDLEPNTAQWRRTTDIIVIADTELSKKRNKRTRPKL